MTVTLEQILKMKEEIEERQVKLDAMIKSFEEQEEAEFPRDGETMYFIDVYGSVGKGNFCVGYDESMLSFGNCFRTREVAEFAIEQLKVIAELKSCGGVFKVKRDAEVEHYLSLSVSRTVSKEWSYAYTDTPDMWFSTEESAQKALDTIGEERLLKYWFNVEV